MLSVELDILVSMGYFEFLDFLWELEFERVWLVNALVKEWRILLE